MTVEEARSVYWLKNNHRPLGELLDEGFLNESRLSWAAEKAYNPHLKEAAGVLLQHLRRRQAASSPETAQGDGPRTETQPTIEAGITIEDARATLWPFRGYRNQPMGELSDTRRLSLKDLVYAVENAWDRRVRQAAVVLLAQRLQQAVKEPDDAQGPPEVVAFGRSYSQKRQMGWVGIQMLGTGIIGVLFLEFAVWSVITFIRNPPKVRTIVQSPTLIVVVPMLLGLGYVLGTGIGKLFELFYDKTEQEIENSYLGQQGEERVIEAMRQNLDGAWTIFRNVTLPGHKKSDIDTVLVGPSGVWALEVKNYQGAYRVRGETWETKAGPDWTLVKTSPSSQAARNAVRLHDYLKANGIQQWVDKAVIWANPEHPPEVRDPAVAVWPFDRLADELGNLQVGRTVDAAQQAAMVETLRGLCRRNAEADPW
jgi:hypothetical protein